MSTDYYLVCDDTRFICGAANACMGNAGDGSSTQRGLYSFIIAHEHHKLRVVSEHSDVACCSYSPYRNWNDLDLDEGCERDERQARIHYALTPDEAAAIPTRQGTLTHRRQNDGRKLYTEKEVGHEV